MAARKSRKDTTRRRSESRTASTPIATSTPGKSATLIEPKMPTQDQIRERAYEIYESRRGERHSPMLDWLEAERELKAGMAEQR